MTLLRSQIIVGCCDAVIASLHRHDFHSCPCGNMAIDGGLDYLRVVGDYPFTDASFGIEQTLNHFESRAAIATYIAIYRAYEDGRKSRGVPMRAIVRYQPSWFTQEDAKRAGYTLEEILGILERNEIVRVFFKVQHGRSYIRYEPLKPLEVRDA